MDDRELATWIEGLGRSAAAGGEAAAMRLVDDEHATAVETVRRGADAARGAERGVDAPGDGGGWRGAPHDGGVGSGAGGGSEGANAAGAEAPQRGEAGRVTVAFECEHNEVEWDVESLELDEGLGRPFEARVSLTTGETTTDPTEMLGRSCRLSVGRGDLARPQLGVVTQVREASSGGRRLRVDVVVEPALALLRLRTDTRIFQDSTVPDVLERVLGEGLEPSGRAVELRLGREYPACEYRTQHDETDLDFCHRLMEEEGITYWFEHEGEAETLVVSDDTTRAPELESAAGAVLEHTEYAGLSNGQEVVRELRAVSRLRPTRVVTRHHDWSNPGAPVGGDSGDEDEDDELRGARVGPERAEYEHDSAPLTLAGFDGRYRENDADAQVRIRRERQRCEALVVEGEATAIGLAPGRIFEVAGHPRPGHDRRWLVRAATHRASARSWSTRFECIPAEVPHRPRRAAARPRISGVQTARVVGPAGEEIHTDEHGRIKVQFHWDRDGRLDERSSCWIHVAQPWAGAGWGFVFVPRIGMEVIVTFVNGDADRPICTGCVYNGENRPPLALPDEKTRSTIRTSSSLGGDGYNELTFEDAAGEEQIIVHAQRDLNETVERAHTTVVGGDQSNSVSGDHSNSVDGEHTEYVGGNQSLTVEGDRQVVVSGLQDFTVEGGNSSHLVTGGSYVLETSDEVTVIAPTRITLRCGSSEIVMTPNRIELCAGGCASLVLDDSVLARSCAGATALLNDDVTAFSNQDARLLLAAAALLCESSQASQLVLADDGAVLNGAGGASVQLTAAMNATSAAGSVVELNDAALLQGASGGSCCLTADCRLESAGGGTVVVAGPVVELNG